jgi:hypothetical protein
VCDGVWPVLTAFSWELPRKSEQRISEGTILGDCQEEKGEELMFQKRGQIKPSNDGDYQKGYEAVTAVLPSWIYEIWHLTMSVQFRRFSKGTRWPLSSASKTELNKRG